SVVFFALTIAAVQVLAGLLAIAGIAIMLYLLFRKQPTAVQEFAEKQALAAGYYMPYDAEIDYLQAYQVAGQPQLVGGALEWRGRSGTEPAGKYLQIKADGTLALAALDNDSDTCFFLDTDERGRALFSSLVTDASGAQSLLALTLGDKDKLSGQAPATGE